MTDPSVPRAAIILSLLLVAGLLVPSAGAVTVDKQLDDGTYYVVVQEPGATAGLYKETNGCPGFQGTAQDCSNDGTQDPPDEAVDSPGEGTELATDAWTHTVTIVTTTVSEATDYALCQWRAIRDIILGYTPQPCSSPSLPPV